MQTITRKQEINLSALTEAGTSKFARIKEGRLDLQVHYNDAGTGEVVFMLHGSGPGASGWSNFHRNIDAFVDAGYRVILLDSPGWNKSDPIVIGKDEFRSDINAAAVKGLMDVLGIERASLVGNSMGGHNSVSFAVNYPERLNKLIVMGGGFAGQSSFVPMPTEGIKRIGALYRNPTTENLKAMLDVFVYDPSALTPDLIQGRFDNIMKGKQHLENFVKSQENNPRMAPDFTPHLPNIKAKTLITWGRDDRFVPLDLGLRLAWGLPDADMYIFNRCGHWAQWEHADKFNKLVLNFLNG